MFYRVLNTPGDLLEKLTKAQYPRNSPRDLRTANDISPHSLSFMKQKLLVLTEIISKV